MTKQKKCILALLPATTMYGKERSNIEVFHLVQDKVNCEINVVINREANDNLKEAVADLNPITITVPERHAIHLRALVFLWTFIIANCQLAYILLRKRPDVLMMSSETDFYSFYPALLLHRGRILYRIGDGPGSYHGLSLYAYNSFVWNHYIMRRVTKVVCISRYIMDCFAQEGRDMSNDIVIYNYPPTRKPTKKDESSLYIQPSSPDSIVFGYLGQVFEQKGVHHYVECALEILEQSPTSLFYVAGSLTYKPDFARMVQQMVPDRWRNNIIFLGEISDIETFFAHIDVLCVPSIKQEPLGNVLVEAKKYSRPCIIYPTGGMPELIRDGKDGFVCTEPSAATLRNNMIRYIRNKSLAHQQGIAAKESIEELGINRELFETKWLNVLQEILK